MNPPRNARTTEQSGLTILIRSGFCDLVALYGFVPTPGTFKVVPALFLFGGKWCGDRIERGAEEIDLLQRGRTLDRTARRCIVFRIRRERRA